MARRTLNVSLTPELEELITDRVDSGRYLSASEVVREGLRLLEERDRVRDEALAEVRQKIEAGIASLDRGEAMNAEALFDELERRIDDREAAARS